MGPDNAVPAGASLLVAWQLKNKQVLIVGGGDVASGRIESVLAADALITIISPNEGLHPLTQRYIKSSDRITYHDRVFAGSGDLVDVDMVLTAVDDVVKSREICDMCRALKIPVNVADIPPSCDFYFGSQIRDGPLQIMISTNGQSPKLANMIKKRIECSLPANAGEAIKRVGELRARLKDRAPGVGGDVGKRRMRWMVDVCTSWDLDDLALLDDGMIKKLLDDGWENNRVPKVEDVGGRRTRTGVSADWTDGALIPPALGFIAGAACMAFVLLCSRR
jgi:precorrin-2 dehydrogenase/sirohydrochlorin ferrochelatase